MISVQNHRLRLSGNNFIFTLICMCIFCSCNPTKKVVDNSTKPIDRAPEMSKVDTIVWQEDTTAPPPIQSDQIVNEETDPSGANDLDMIPKSERKESYNIAVLFPFYSKTYVSDNDRSKKKSLRAIQLYGGMQLAMEKLEKENIDLKFNIYDTQGDVSETRSILQQPEVYGADLVFGPFRSENLKVGSQLAIQYKKAFISPMNPSDKITERNPFFVQMKPSFSSHVQAITDHVMEDNLPQQVVVVARDKNGERERIQMFQDALAQNQKSKEGDRFREYLVSDYGNEFENMDFSNFVIEGAKTVFIVPSWSKEAFVINVLRKIRLVKGANEVVVYGMPQWKDFQRISYDDYAALQVHISSDNRLDKQQQNIQNFAKAYYYKFGEAPNEDAYFGYDMTLCMVKNMIKHGTQFQMNLDASPYTGLASIFDFEKVYDLEEESLETAPMKMIANKHVDILKFSEFIFQLAE